MAGRIWHRRARSSPRASRCSSTSRWRARSPMRALRPYASYGAVVFRKDAKGQTSQVGTPASSYVALVREIVKFVETRVPPVSNEETLELFAFLDAAQRSKEAGGKPMRLR